MRVLALDCATKTGWATADRHGVRAFNIERGSSPGMRFLNFQTWVRWLIAETNPEVVVYEIAHQRGGAATELCVGFTTRVMQEAAQAGIEYKGCHSRTLKAYATGNGNASKEQVIAAAKARWPEIQIVDDNHADALFLHAWGVAGFPDVVKERQEREAAEKQRRKDERAQKALEALWMRQEKRKLAEAKKAELATKRTSLSARGRKGVRG